MSGLRLLLLAQEASTTTATTGGSSLLRLLGSTVLFTVIGMIAFTICFWIIVKLCPFSVKKEIEEDQNTSLAIIIGSIIIGIAMIISAAVHG
jgi:uncharacterized membrane protein YjfL (UPF0719 family)